MVKVMRAMHLIAIGLVCAAAAACSEGEPRQEPRASSTADYASSGTVFDLTPVEREALERRATSGDGEASFRLSQFYSMAGGLDGSSEDNLDDTMQNLRWLELAASQGHETATFKLAVMLARSGRDCTRGRALMTSIASKASASSDTVRSAGHWLRDESFKCKASEPEASAVH
jgi:TPR repeat protein